MKRIFYKVCVLIIIFQANCLAQELGSREIRLKYDFGKSMTELNKTNGQNICSDVSPHLVRDITFDSNNKIYVLETHDKKVIQFNVQGEAESIIDLNKDFSDVNFNRLKITTDNNDLYILLLFGEFYVRLIKYTEGELDKNYELKTQMPIGRNINVIVSNGIVRIKTFPSSIDPRHHAEGDVFVYDNNGHFLGRTDYFFKDKKGLIYKKKGRYDIEVYQAEEDNEITKTKNLKRVKVISVPQELRSKTPEQDMWYLAGIDNKNHIYISNNNYKILRCSPSKEEVEKVVFDVEKIKKQKIFLPNSTKIKVNNSGNLFLLGFSENSENNTYSEVVIISNQ